MFLFSTLTLSDSNTIINPISEGRKSRPLKDCENPQKYKINGPNDAWQLSAYFNPWEGSNEARIVRGMGK